jgi:tetratricopeptide (TPR) repeat protein
MNRTSLRRWIALAAAISGSGLLSGCLWLNTLFNARKAWELAEISRERRFRKNPLDTVPVSADERTLYLRAITKGAKVLELWPNDSSWHAEALIVIGRSQQRLSDWDRAYRSYDEIVEHYPGSVRLMPAIQGEIECLVALGRYEQATELMARLDSLKVEGGPAGLAWLKAQIALGRLDTLTARRELGRILSIREADPDRKAQAAWLSGTLAWAQADWADAREKFLLPDILRLPYVQRFRAHLYAALALERTGTAEACVKELRAMAKGTYKRSESEILLELGRLELAHGWFSDALRDLGAMETLLEPPEKVAEGMLLLGDDARLRRIDDREALRVYLIGARVGGAGFFGQRDRSLADALQDLGKLRERKVVDSTRVDWLFDLAELHLLRLSSRDSAVAQYRRILSDTSSKRPQKARASYALAWIADDAKSDSGGGAREAWLQVARDYPSTEFAKAAQRNAGVPVTERTAADSAEARYRQAEILWMDKGDPKAAAAAFAAMEDRVTEPGKRAYWAVAWIHDNLLHDSAKAAPAYRRVVDSLPGTRWAQRADAILKGQPRDFLEGRTIEHHADDDFVEGTEKLDSTRTKFGPRKPNPSGLLPADVPEPIPPRPEDQFLTPEDFN